MSIRIYRMDEMRALEAAADRAGYSYDEMMERAGIGVAEHVAALLAEQPGPVAVLAGPGNNGGDALVAARRLAALGHSVRVLPWRRPVDDPRLISATAAGAHERALPDSITPEEVARWLQGAVVLVDGLFGTGLSRPIEGPAAALLDGLRAAAAPPSERRVQVVAVDLPSGLTGDHGAVDPHTVPATVTVTFAGPKLALFSPAAAEVVGQIEVAPLGIPAPVRQGHPGVAELLTPGTLRSRLLSRSLSGHKGTFGTVLVVGGHRRYVGAPALSARAAGRSGAGLVTLAVPEAIYPLLAAQTGLQSATWLPLPTDPARAVGDIARAAVGADALVVGPGLGAGQPGRELARRLLLDGPAALPPVVVDADGLNALAEQDGWWRDAASPLVLTPHPGEMARLLGRERNQIQTDRLSTALEAATRFGEIVVLKGAFTIVAAPDGRAGIVPVATSALARAGTGDILAGMIGALLATGHPPYDAAAIGATVHAAAGLRLALPTARAALSSDLLHHLPAAWADFERTEPS